jgi:hypothetical protein
MTVPASAPGPGALAELARDALLDHLSRGDARHAVRLLLEALARLHGLPCRVRAFDAQGAVAWDEGAADVRAPARSVDLDHLGRRVGRIELPAAATTTLEPVLPTLAALLGSGPAAGQSVREAATLIRAALAGADTFVWEWDLDSDRLGDIDEGLKMLGYEPAGFEMTQQAWNRLIHPADLQANDDAYLRHARGETSFYEHEYRVRDADGQWRWMLERGRIVERHADGRPRRVAGIQVDSTGRRAMAEAVTEATRRLARIAEHVPGLLYQYEIDAARRERFRYVSARTRDLFGVEPERVLGDPQAVFAVIDEDDRTRMGAELRRSLREMSEWRCEFRVQRPDGRRRWMLGSATPERMPDGRTVWYGYIEDVTSQRELEQARRDALVAEAASRAKTQFLGRMSHELRTPLNAVLGFAQLMEIDRDEPPAPGQARRLRLVREAGEHLLRMIGDLLDLTRIESGGMTLHPEPLAPRVVADQAIAMVADAAARAQVTLALDIAADAEAPFEADRARLLQVLLNLLSNAVKYNRPGGSATLRVSVVSDPDAVRAGVAADVADVADAASAAAAALRWDVVDTGVGIAAADLERVFEPFQRGAQEGGPVEGAGIGLAVTQAVVTLMGGRIEARSEPGVGSIFSVTLPRR